MQPLSMQKILFLSLIVATVLQDKLQAQSNYYFGSMHSHSAYSDGNEENNPAFTTARSCFEYVDQRTLHIDFWGISDHNHSSAGMSLPDYQKGVKEADSVNQNGSFCSFYGMEWGVISTGGHVVVYGIDSLVGWDNNNYLIFNAQQDYDGLFRKIAARGDDAFGFLAHMQSSDFSNILAISYQPVWDSAITGMAIRNGPAFSDDTTYSSLPSLDYFDRYLDMLAKGYRVGPVIDHDNHYIVFGRTHTARTVVIADSLTRSSLRRAFRRGSFYASDDWNAKVKLDVNQVPMGSNGSGDAAAAITMVIDDEDNEPPPVITIYAGVPGNGLDALPVFTSNGIADSIRFTHIAPVNDTYYYFAVITQADGDKIWTSPVWYTKTGPPPPYDLISFEAELEDRYYPVLRWTLFNENNLDRIDIESSSDNNQFDFRESRAAIGLPSELSNYTWRDPQPISTPTWYRLRIYEDNGSLRYSPVRKLDPQFRNLSLNFQNTSDGTKDIWLTIETSKDEPVRLEIFDTGGRLVVQSSFFIKSGINVIPLQTTLLSSGMYIVRISNTNYSETAKAKLIRY